MKKLLLVLLIIGGLVAASSAVTKAEPTPSDPELTVAPSTGTPSFAFTATVTNCAPEFGLLVDSGPDFRLLGTVVFTVTATDADGNPTGDPIGVPIEENCTDEALIAMADLVAPDQVGTYAVRAVLNPPDTNENDLDGIESRTESQLLECAVLQDSGVGLDDVQLANFFRPCFLTAPITVTAPDPTTTTTMAAPTTTAAATTTAPTTAPTTTVAPTTAAPTTTVASESEAVVPESTDLAAEPVVTLPATGPGDSGVALLALLLLVAGAALVVGARGRREHTSV